jgi:uncharacterized membrane protein
MLLSAADERLDPIELLCAPARTARALARTDRATAAPPRWRCLHALLPCAAAMRCCPCPPVPHVRRRLSVSGQGRRAACCMLARSTHCVLVDAAADHMAMRSAAALGLWALVMERGLVHDAGARSIGLWLCVGASSVVAFALNLAQFLVTQATSAVTLQVLGNIKVVLLILLSVAIFGNEVSLQAAAGCALCIVGVVLYNRATARKPDAAKQQRV